MKWVFTFMSTLPFSLSRQWDMFIQLPMAVSCAIISLKSTAMLLQNMDCMQQRKNLELMYGTALRLLRTIWHDLIFYACLRLYLNIGYCSKYTWIIGMRGNCSRSKTATFWIPYSISLLGRSLVYNNMLFFCMWKWCFGKYSVLKKRCSVCVQHFVS